MAEGAPDAWVKEKVKKNGYAPITAILEEGVSSAQLALKVSHLEADVKILRHRKEELEHENEALAAAARPDLEEKVLELQQELAALRARKEELEREREAWSSSQLKQLEADRDQLQEECQKRRLESERHAELEKQQQDVAKSFAELQGVVSQLLPWLSELYEQRARLVEEKTAAEESATRLRTELQRWRLLWTAPSALVDDARPRNSSPARKGPMRASSMSATKRAAEVYGRDLHRRPSPCRLRCRAEDEKSKVPAALIELQGELRRLAPGQKVNEAQVQEILALLKKTGNGDDSEAQSEPTTLKALRRSRRGTEAIFRSQSIGSREIS